MLYVFFFLFLFSELCSKTLIIAFNYNNPEFIEIQKKTFEKFVKSNFEFVIFSDAPTQAGHQEILNRCNELGLRCIRIPQHIHESPYYLPLNMPEIYPNHTVPSNVRHVHAVQYSLNYMGFDFDGNVMLIDTDMFLVRNWDIDEYMQDCDIAAFFKGSSNEQGATIMYCCPALTILNMKRLPDKKTLNFNCGWVNGCSGDSGGFTHYYIKAHPQLKMKYFDTLYSGNLYCTDRFFSPAHNHTAVTLPLEDKIAYWNNKGFTDKEISFLSKNPDTIQFFMEGKDAWFLHYRGGTNYEKLGAGYHNHKKALINEYISNILQ